MKLTSMHNIQCDRSKPRCSRCAKRNTSCIPSSSAQWRVSSVLQASQQKTASRRASIPSNLSASSPPAVTSTNNPSLSQAEIPLHESLEILAGNEPSNTWNGDGAVLAISPALEYDPMFLDKLWALPLQPNAQYGSDACSTGILNDLTSHINEDMMNPRMPLLPCPESYLWEEFIQAVVPGISLDGQEPSNQVTEHLTLKALGKPIIFSAVVFFSYSVRLNWSSENSSLITFDEMSEAALKMEQEAGAYLESIGHGDTDTEISGHQQHITVLAVLVALSSAYIARGDEEKLYHCLERAMRTAREGFMSDLSTDRTFLFLVRWIGYIHVAGMLGRTSYPISAPNYLGIAANLNPVHSNSDVFFQDLDSFLGISQSVGDILYRIGRVLCSIRLSNETGPGDGLRSDIADAEIRLDLILRQLKRFKHEHGELGTDLDLYNEALCHSGLLLLLINAKDEPYHSTFTQSIVSQILDSCAAVPETAPAAKLMLLPLFHAGICTSRPLHQAFIRRRLEVLRSGCCIVNVNRTVKILEDHWSGLKARGNTQGTSHISSYFRSIRLIILLADLPSSTVCIFF